MSPCVVGHWGRYWGNLCFCGRSSPCSRYPIRCGLQVRALHKRNEGCERCVCHWIRHADRVGLLLALGRQRVGHVIGGTLRRGRTVGRQVKEVARDHQSVKLALLVWGKLRAVHGQWRAYYPSKAALLL